MVEAGIGLNVFKKNSHVAGGPCGQGRGLSRKARSLEYRSKAEGGGKSSEKTGSQFRKGMNFLWVGGVNAEGRL